MIKRLLALCMFLFAFFGAKAQPYRNEWINYSQSYYKIKITQDGIYRIDSATLFAAGIPINSIDPHNFQIFNKGVQQYIYIQGESDGILNSSDFIEFYGQKNDGKLDSLLYVNTPFVPNPYNSLVNDTAVYYLTWNSSFTNNRMQSVAADSTFASYSPAAYFFKEEIQNFHSGYYEGETDVVGGTDPRYTRSEGWFDNNVINLGSTNTYSLSTNNRSLIGPNALIKAVAVGASKDIAVLATGSDHHLKIQYNGHTLADTLFKGYELNRFIQSVPVSNLASPSTNFTFTSVSDPGFTSNRTAISYVYVKYPHTYDLEGFSNFLMCIPDSSVSRSHLNLSNLSVLGKVHVYDLSNAKRIEVVQVGTNYHAMIANTGGEKKCYVTSDGYITYITSLQPVTPSAQFTNFLSLAADSAFLIVTNKVLMPSVLNYKAYRSSNFYGGFHNVIIADIDELYDQFAFGIVKSPLSIRGFSEFTLDKYPTAPKDLFIIGKGIHLHEIRYSPADYANCLVPSFGNPACDNLFTSNLNGLGIAPAIPTGRLAVASASQVDAYLDKVKDYENKATNPPDDWMKYVLHFGGGTSASEQATFAAYLNSYKAIIQDTLYGGIVQKDFFKTSSAPIEINLSDTLRDLIDGGVSLLTFFGHASSDSFDESIDQITTYNPIAGHYPFMLSNGCYSGDLHTTDVSSSEKFVLFPSKGVIGFLGSVGLGVPYALNQFSTEFYHQIALSNYGNGVGSSMKKAINAIAPFAATDSLIRATCYEMSLHGDPEINLNAQTKPDYKITGSDVYFDLTSKVDSFVVSAVRTNIGKAIKDTMITEIQRIFPNGDTTHYLIRNAAPKFKDTVHVTFWNDNVRGIGLNKIKVTLDLYSEISELNEMNNTTNPAVEVLINGGDIVPVYPYTFAIIPKDTVTLKASTADPFAAAKNYVFQIDTTDRFNSPLMRSAPVTSVGGVVTWHPPITFTNTTVYYWRVSRDSTSVSSGYRWRESSFQYITNKRGWEQAHFFQFKGDGYQFVKFDRPIRKFDFANDIKSLQCINGVYPYIYPLDISYRLNGDLLHYWTCAPFTGVSFAVFSPYDGNPKLSVLQPAPPPGAIDLTIQYGQYGDAHCVPRDLNSFDFYSNEASYWRPKIKNFIDSIPTGSYVLAYSQGDMGIHMDTTLYRAFEKLGSAHIRTLPTSVPYILFGKKGNAIGNSKEVIGDSAAARIELDTAISTNWTDGYIASPVIGPAVSWDSLSWKWHTLDGAGTKDSIVVRLIGIKADGTEWTLANFNKTTLNIANLFAYAPATIYPNIRLVAYMKDDSLHTPPQLDRWQVIYTPVPEAAINPPRGYSFTNSTLQEGDNINIKLPIQNISEFPFTQDSLLVTYWIEDANRAVHNLPVKLKKKPFLPGEVILDSIIVNTTGYPGSNALWVEVNPTGKPHSQLEQYHFNNIARIPFTVNTDHINPLLDVTFDGVHILNNDIISAKPNVLVQLKDENQFLALNDTNDFKVFLQSPTSSTAVRQYFGTMMSFIPAVLPNNSCKINFTPQLGQDGTYQLLIQAKDKSNNLSGAIDYKINFEVINKPSITEVMNYPNPFSTATHFVFTLTGSEVPTYFKIQIMTITGKVVREITNDELGLIHVGRNVTDYAWNGKDEFGDQLANGVYLYRVVTTIRGADIERRETEADQYFKKGWGKMYLLR